MLQRATVSRRAVLALSVLALAGCGAAPAPTATPLPPPTSTPAPPPTATTAPPTATAVPPTATTAPVATKPAAAAATKPVADAAKPTAAAKPGASGGGSVPPELQQVAKAMAGLKSYTMTGTITSKTRGKMEMTADYVAPDRRRMEIKGATPEQSMGFVTIGPDTYVKMGPAWQKLPAGQGGAMSMDFFDASWVDRTNEAGVTMTAAGSEAVNGEPCTVYTFTDKDGSKGKLWVSTRDSTMRKFEVVDNDGDEVSMLVSNINQPMTINPPM